MINVLDDQPNHRRTKVTTNANIALALILAALTGCMSEEQRAKNRAESDKRWREQAVKDEYDRAYNACIYRVTGPFGSASVDVMRECARLAKEGKSA